MKSLKSILAVVALASAAVSGPAFAYDTIQGWTHHVTVGMVDVAEGYVCQLPAPWNTTGYLSVILDDGHGGNYLYGDYPLADVWGSYDWDNMCGGYNYVGFSLMGWFYQNRITTMTIRYRNSGGDDQWLGTFFLEGPGTWYPH